MRRKFSYESNENTESVLLLSSPASLVLFFSSSPVLLLFLPLRRREEASIPTDGLVTASFGGASVRGFSMSCANGDASAAGSSPSPCLSSTAEAASIAFTR